MIEPGKLWRLLWLGWGWVLFLRIYKLFISNSLKFSWRLLLLNYFIGVYLGTGVFKNAGKYFHSLKKEGKCLQMSIDWLEH